MTLFKSFLNMALLDLEIPESLQNHTFDILSFSFTYFQGKCVYFIHDLLSKILHQCTVYYRPNTRWKRDRLCSDLVLISFQIIIVVMYIHVGSKWQINIRALFLE